MEILIGLTIGTVLGLTGAGGSIFAVPLLILLLGMETTEAMGLALGAVAVSSLTGAYRLRGLIDWQTILPLVAGGMIAAPTGKWVSLFLNDTLLVSGFSVIAITIAIRMLKQASSNPEDASLIRASTPNFTEASREHELIQQEKKSTNLKYLSGFFLGGIIVGFASGLFGVGGGFLIVPLLVIYGKFSMPRAIASSLASIAFISGAGFASYSLLSPSFSTSIFLKVIIAAIVGMLFSQRLSAHIKGANLQKTFSILLIIVSFVLILKQIVGQ